MFKKKTSKNARKIRKIHDLSVEAYNYLLWKEPPKKVELTISKIISLSHELMNELEEDK